MKRLLSRKTYNFIIRKDVVIILLLICASTIHLIYNFSPYTYADFLKIASSMKKRMGLSESRTPQNLGLAIKKRTDPVTEEELLASVKRLSFKEMTPSSILLEDMYFTPDLRLHLNYTDPVILSPKDLCEPTSPELLILVPSIPESVQARKVIRETWGSVVSGKAWPWKPVGMTLRLIFVLGVGGVKSVTPEEEEDAEESLVRTFSVSRVEDLLRSGVLNLHSLLPLSSEEVESLDPVPNKVDQLHQKNRNITEMKVMRTSKLNQRKIRDANSIRQQHGSRALSRNARMLSQGKHTAKQLKSYIPISSTRVQSRETILVHKEASLYNDILLFDMVDSYKNLTRKIIQAFQYVTTCNTLRYILKVDQDIFVNIPLLTTFLKHHAKPNSIYGHLYASASVRRSGKWSVNTSVLPIETYPIYASGNAYVLTYDAMVKILSLVPRFRYVPIEDAFLTGILASVARVHRVHVTGFVKWTDSRPDACDFVNDKRFVGNRFDEYHSRRVWRELVDRGGGRC